MIPLFTLPSGRPVATLAALSLILPLSPLAADEPAVRAAMITTDQAAADLLAESLPAAAGRGIEWVDDPAEADTLLAHASQGDRFDDAQLETIEQATERGAGLVLLHHAIAAADADLMQPLAGAGWTADSRSFHSRMSIYWITDKHDLVRGTTPFDVDDDTLYDLRADYGSESIDVIASAFTPKLSATRHPEVPAGEEPTVNIYDIQPQAWAWQADQHRAVTMLQGGVSTLQHHAFQSMILRALAWSAGHDDVDLLLDQTDVEGLRYPQDGARPAAEVAANLQLHPGFTASVIASEPLINKPIAVQWDAAGRLWVAETPEYPNGRRPSVNEPWIETGVLEHGNYDRPARDRISILTNPDESGRFTDKTVWFDGLELVTAFCFHKDGVIAAHQPEIIFIRDTNGDGTGDTVETLFTGFQAGDTHFIPNHFIAAPDGWIYANMGGRATPRSADGREFDPVSAGVFRFKPDGSAIEQVSSKGGNAFGNEVTSSMELFFGQATTGNPLQHIVIPEWLLQLGRIDNRSGAHSVIERRRVIRESMPTRAPLVQIDVVGGYSAACASLIYEGGAWPHDDWHRGSFVTEPLLNIVHHEVLRPDGSTFTGEMVRTDAEFIYTDDYWFRPIALGVAPDGSMHVLDFYTQVVAHNDTRGPQHSRSHAAVRPDREHYFGRIYRIHHEQAADLDVPDLTDADAATLAAALRHPNKGVRFHAHRLLCDLGGDDAVEAFAGALGESGGEPLDSATRVLGLWGLHRLGALGNDQLQAALGHNDPPLRANAALVIEDAARGGDNPGDDTAAALLTGLGDEHPHAVIPRLRALAATGIDHESATALAAIIDKLPDDYALGAAVAAAGTSPAAFLRAALLQPAADTDHLERAAIAVAPRLAQIDTGDTAELTALLLVCAGAADDKSSLVGRILTELSAADAPAAVDDAMRSALQTLLAAESAAVRSSALPLALAWDSDGALTETLKPVVADLLEELRRDDLAGERAAMLVSSLLRVRTIDDDVMPTVSGLLQADPPRSEDLQRHVLEQLAAIDDPAAGDALVSTFDQLPAGLRQPALDAIVSRAPWALTFLQAIDAGTVSARQLGPAGLFRLRTHPNEEVAQLAGDMLEQLRGASSDKDEVIAELLPEVSRPGDAAVGRVIFENTCAMCHRHEDLGVDLGPVLTGVGVHGPANLLTRIIDPNRLVEPGNEAWNIETTDGRQLAGLIAQENPREILLRMPGAELRIPQSEIASRTNTGRSLMPEGYEHLGPEVLRDLLTYLGATQSRHRVIDLSTAFTADTRQGLYHSQERTGDTLPFVEFGLVEVDGVPFEIVDPERSRLGGNVIVLQGGPRGVFSRTMPQEVDVPVGFAASRLHVLGAVAGWGALQPDEGELVLTFRLEFADGETREVEWFNGVEIADYIRDVDVPGSKLAEGIVSRHAVRVAAIDVEHDAVIERIVLTSAGRGIAPTTVAITAEL